MASPLIEGIDNEVLFVVSVLVVIVAICLVHLLKNSNSSFSLNSRQNTSNTNSVASFSSEGRAQENSSEEQDTRPADDDPVTGDLTQTATSQSHNNTNDEHASEPVNNASSPEMDRNSDGVRWRGNERTPDFGSQSSSAGDCISIRVKFMENERTLSVNRMITVGELKRLCFLNELNNGRRVRLIFSGRLLQDDTTPISFYGVTNYSVVHAQISDVRRDSEHSTTPTEEADLDLSKLFLPILAIVLVLCWYGFFYYRHLFSAASIIILVFMTLAFGVLAHAITA